MQSKSSALGKLNISCLSYTLVLGDEAKLGRKCCLQCIALLAPLRFMHMKTKASLSQHTLYMYEYNYAEIVVY